MSSTSLNGWEKPGEDENLAEKYLRNALLENEKSKIIGATFLEGRWIKGLGAEGRDKKLATEHVGAAAAISQRRERLEDVGVKWAPKCLIIWSERHQKLMISHSHNIHNTGLKKCYYKGSITWDSATTWSTESMKRYEEELFSVMWLVSPRLVQLMEAETRLASIFLLLFLRIFMPDSEVRSQSSVLTKNWGMI